MNFKLFSFQKSSPLLFDIKIALIFTWGLPAVIGFYRILLALLLSHKQAYFAAYYLGARLLNVPYALYDASAMAQETRICNLINYLPQDRLSSVKVSDS